MHAATLIARTAGGVQAFVAGRRVGQEWHHGRLIEREVRTVLERESVPGLVMGAAAVGAAAFAMVRKPELLALALAGVLVGSGALEKIVRKAERRGARRSRASRVAEPGVAPE